MNLFTKIRESLDEILDMDDSTQVTPETYVIRELGAESIDLLELAVTLNNRTNTDIVDDDIFLRKLREFIIEADQKGASPAGHLAEKYPFLSRERIDEILGELENGPVLKVNDMVSYIAWRGNNGSRSN